jgi:integrase
MGRPSGRSEPIERPKGWGVSMIVLATVLEESLFARARAPATIEKYGGCLRRLASQGVARAADATPATIARFVEWRLASVRDRTAAADCLALFAVLGHLASTGRLDPATITALRPVCPDVPGHETLCAAFMDEAEVERISAIAAAARSPLLDLTLRLAVLSGLRAGELARLRWSDVDLARKVLSVRSTSAAPTKTRRSRLVPVVAELVHVLQDHPGAVHTRAGAGLVLSRRPALSERTLARRIETIEERAACRLTLNLCRHTRASWWIQRGVAVARVALWMGHSVQVCLDHYAGLLHGYDPEADRTG